MEQNVASWWSRKRKIEDIDIDRSFLGKKILVVDEDDFYLKLVHYFVAKTSAHLVWESCVMKASKQLSSNSFDLMLIDLKFRNQASYGLIKKVNQNYVSMPVYSYVSTAYSYLIPDASELGVDKVTLKEYDENEFLESLSLMLKGVRYGKVGS